MELEMPGSEPPFSLPKEEVKVEQPAAVQVQEAIQT
jgi:hypothetical protein